MKVSLLSPLRLVAIVVSLLSFLANNAAAATYYWDPNGLATPTSGTWDSTTPQWSATPDVTSSLVAWDPANIAAFSATNAGAGNIVSPLTITVNSQISLDGTINGTAGAAGVTQLFINGSGSLELASGVHTFASGTGFNTTINVPITGSGGVQNSGGGSLFLYGVNTYTGGTTFATTTGMNFNNSSSFGTGPITSGLTSIVLATPSGAASSAFSIANDVFANTTAASTIIHVGLVAAPVTFSGAWSMGSQNQTLDFRTATVAAPTTISGVISGSGTLTKLGGGNLVLSGANTYTGKTIVNNGVLSVRSYNKVVGGTASSSLGAPTTVADGTINLGATTVAVTNRYFGTGETTDRVINLSGTTGGATIQHDGTGTGALNFTSAFTATGAGSKTLTLQGTNTANNTISGAIVNNSAANITSLTKSGTGKWVLSGANTYSGKTTIGNGTLSVNSLNKVSGGSASSSLGAPVTVANGTIAFGATTTTGTLIYTGAGETTDRVINLAGTTGGGSIQNDGAGALTFTSDLTATGAGAKTLTLRGSNTGNNTFGGKIVDSTAATSVTKNDAGKWILAGANTYTGNTTVTAGTLALGNSAALGSSGVVTVTGTLDLNGFNSSINRLAGAGSVLLGGNTMTLGNTVDATFSGVISGTGGLIKQGAFTQTLSGNNTYSGTTTVNAGEFGITTRSTGGGAYVVGAGTLSVQRTSTDASLNVSSLTVNSSTTELDLNGLGFSTAGVVSSIGNLNLTGTTLVDVRGFNSIGTSTLIQYGTRSGAGTLALGLTPLRTSASLIDDTLNNRYLLNVTSADSLRWVGDVSGNWDVNNAANPSWVLQNAATATYYQESGGQGDTVRFDDTATGSTIVSLAAVTPFQIVVDNSTKDYTFTNGSISGLAGGLTKSGSGTLTINTGPNTFAGGTTLNAGTILAGTNTAMGVAGGRVTVNGGTIASDGATARTLNHAWVVNSDLTLGQVAGGTGALTLSGTMDLAGGTRTFNTANLTDTISAGISNGGIIKAGDGTLVLSSAAGANTYSGDTRVDAGVLSINGTVSLGTGKLIFNGGNFLQNANRTSANTLTNDVELRADTTFRADTAGAGFRDTRFSGKLIDSGGNLTIANNGTVNGTNDVYLSGGDYTFSRNITIGIGGETGQARLSIFNVNTADPVTLSGIISGTGSFRRSASTAGTGGTVILSGANTYTGGTVLNDGEIALGISSVGPAGAPTSGPLGTGVVTIGGSSGKLSAFGGSRVVGNNILFTSTTLALIGSNDLELSGNVDFGGSVRTIQVDNTGASKLSGALSNGGVIKTGNGVLTLSGVNTYSGTTTINGGKLKVSGSAASSAFAVATGGTLSGSGTVGTVALEAGSTLAPGDSPGTITTGDQSWAGLANYTFEINDATGTAGADPGWDLDNIIGSLTIGATPGSQFNINVTSLTLGNVAGDADNFDKNLSYSWKLATASGGITGFDAAAFNIVTSGFSNDTAGAGLGTWYMTQAGNDVLLNFAAVPEPSTVALGIMGGLAFIGTTLRRRFKK